VPHSQSDHELECIRDAAFALNALSRCIEALPKSHAEVGRQFAADLVPESETYFHIVDAPNDTEFTVPLKRDFRLEARL
jgi:hypothetical protein